MNDPQVINHAALSALLTQTEAMLTIQRNKYDAHATELPMVRIGSVKDLSLVTQMGILRDEISLLENIAQQLRAAGVIPK